MPLRLVGLPVGAVLSAVVIAGCGSGSSNSSSTTPQGGRAAFNDPKVQACLEKQGVTLPDFPRGNGGTPPGAPPTGTNSAPPRRPNGAPPGGGNPAQFQKLQAALQKCGVDFQPGQNGPGGPPPGAPGTTGQ